MADDVDRRIESLEQQLAEMGEEQDRLRQQLVEAQLDQWKGRIDELEVQMHLGRLEAGEAMEPLLEQLRGRWLDTREQVGSATAVAGDAFGALRTGVEQAMDDLRAAVDRARKAGG